MNKTALRARLAAEWEKLPLSNDFMFRCYELELFHLSPNRQATGGKCPHSHPYPLQSSG